MTNSHYRPWLLSAKKKRLVTILANPDKYSYRVQMPCSWFVVDDTSFTEYLALVGLLGFTIIVEVRKSICKKQRGWLGEVPSFGFWVGKVF